MLARYSQLLRDAPHGLIGPNDRDRAGEHVDDALSVLPVIAGLPHGTIIDVGTGAGLPGIPLGVELAESQVALVETNGKKATFLRECVEALGIEARFSVLWQRVEQVARDDREAWDLAISRALAPPVTALEWLAPLVRVGGNVVILTTGRLAAETGLLEAAPLLGLSEPRTEPLTSSLRDDAVAVVAHKTSATPAKFPRREGDAKRKPLA